jgi:putative ABC transport system permease protein
MSIALADRPTLTGSGDGGFRARRAVIRWAWRLFRREWRQQLLVLALITTAVTATMLGAAVATNAPPPRNAVFGTANHLALIPGSDPHLAADLAALRQRVGRIEVIESQNIATGTVATAELRAQNPYGQYGSGLLRLVSGRYPVGPNEVGLTRTLATTYDVGIGGSWHAGGRARRVVGVVENPQNLADQFALVAPGQLTAPTQVSVLFDSPLPRSGSRTATPLGLPSNASVEVPSGPGSGISPAIIVLVLATFGLLFIGLVSVAGFTVMAQRRVRALGMLGALGATDRHIRLVMIANGVVVGAVATIVGTALGFIGWAVYRPHLQTSAGHVIGLLHLPWWLIVTAIALAVITATAAAWWPARTSAQLPVMAALSGRPPSPTSRHRSVLLAAILVIAGFGLIWLAAPKVVRGRGGPPEVVLGIVTITIGGLILAPFAIVALARVGRHSPISIRLALRDLARYRARSGAALGAISFAIVIAVVTCVAATARYSDPLDYFGPNLPANQLAVYTGSANLGPGEFSGPTPRTAAQAHALQHLPASVAAALGSRDVLTLSSTSATLFQAHSTTNNFNGPVYVATPALLRHYGIAPSSIDPTTDVLTSRTGLAAVPRLVLLYGNYAGPTPGPGHKPTGGPPTFACVTPVCVAHPKIQTLSALPADTATPNVLVTEHAVRTLGLHPTTAGWIVQTDHALTATQINAARQLATAANATIETKSDAPSLSELNNYATGAGLLLALGVLAMTVGLIRSETASDLRILSATGASSTTRRSLTSATAGSLALLGALIGTTIAYLALIAFFRTRLSTSISHVPVDDLLVILIGLPLAAVAGGWLLAGRQPAMIARQPID